jgi:5-(carboxyamino)imidazole ribonucleotide synthase
LILEQAIAFECELSVVAARGGDGDIACYEPFENVHHNHILDQSICPARVPRQVLDHAMEISRGLMSMLDVVGVLCVEFFLAPGGRLLINEIAPRPHNSGHLTLDACATSQFEQQVRAVCGLPLGSTRQFRPAAMANLLGDLWRDGPPPWHRALACPDVKLHLYGKNAARPGRKMGHLTALGDDVHEAARRVREARDALRGAAARDDCRCATMGSADGRPR